MKLLKLWNNLKLQALQFRILPSKQISEVPKRAVFRARKYFSPSNLLTLYKAQVRPGLQYCSHIWGAAAPNTFSIIDAGQRRTNRLIGDPTLTCRLQSLSHRRAVGDLSLF
nr:unnamed protein product [Callosobruchus chinensis]